MIVIGNKLIREKEVRIGLEVNDEEIIADGEDKREGLDIDNIVFAMDGQILSMEGARGIFFIISLELDFVTPGKKNIVQIKF